MARKMTARQRAKLAELLGKHAEITNDDPDDLQEKVDPLLSIESHLYEGQAVLNFFENRIKPLVEKGESAAKFDARFKEWRFKSCAECNETFAYAFSYNGVKFCTLNCLDAALKKIGLKVTRDRDLKLRWGTNHPAVVPPSALKALDNLYPGSVFPSETLVGTDLPNSQNSHSSPLLDTVSAQGN